MAQSDTRTVDCERTARDVIDAVGGSDNVVASNVCMTRLRLSVDDVSLVASTPSAASWACRAAASAPTTSSSCPP